MKTTLLKIATVSLALLFCLSCNANPDELSGTDTLIIDHSCTNIFKVPVQYIDSAKKQLVIAYGHTSHGSQIITGMEGLDHFMASHDYTSGLFTFNSDGSDGALELHDTPFEDAYDLGNPDFTSWASATRKYLNANSNIKVIMWSWCGEASWASTDDIDGYLSLMSELENDFPDVKFVYMTGHLDGTGAEGQLNQNNNRIRNYCTSNKKILFDFADIESYDPEGTVNYMELYANDNCDYTASNGDSKNWATDWMASHTENVDWYACDAAHTQALNGNRKAYAAWWLFARLAGWEPDGGTSDAVDLKKDPDFKWTVAGNCLKVWLPFIQQINKVELFDTNGQMVYCSNSSVRNNEISILLSSVGLKQNSIALFRIIAEGKSYSGKFAVNTF